MRWSSSLSRTCCNQSAAIHDSQRLSGSKKVNDYGEGGGGKNHVTSPNNGPNCREILVSRSGRASLCTAAAAEQRENSLVTLSLTVKQELGTERKRSVTAAVNCALDELHFIAKFILGRVTQMLRTLRFFFFFSHTFLKVKHETLNIAIKEKIRKHTYPEGKKIVIKNWLGKKVKPFISAFKVMKF